MKRPMIVGVMGGAEVADGTAHDAYRLGELIARKGWILLNGGRNAGVMAASARGAAQNGGITVGILPDADTSQTSEHIQIAIPTGMGSARNTINVLSSDIVVACRGGAGTISEIALALKHGKKVITLNFDVAALFQEYIRRGTLFSAPTPEAVVAMIEEQSEAVRS